MIPSAADIAFAPASPLGGPSVAAGAGCATRAVIRLSGPGTFELLDALVVGKSPRNRGIVPVRLRLSVRGRLGGPTVADEPLELPCLLITYPAPRSFTGQDSAELVTSASPIVVEQVLAAIGAWSSGDMPARPAEPGEFAARAFLAGRLSLTQAEGIAALIRAGTDEQVAAAKRVMSGQTVSDHRRLADELATLLALVEAGIDFTDQEDVVPIPLDDLRSRLDKLRRDIASLLPDSGARRSRDMQAVVVLVGRPNAGKSALFNTLLGRSRSIVADLAGTTRDVIREELELAADLSGTGEGVRCVLCDLPGLDTKADADVSGGRGGRTRESGIESIECQAREGALLAIANAEAVVWCDPTGRFDERDLAEWRVSSGGDDADDSASVIRVRTKADMPRGAGGGERTDDASSIAVSSIDGRNLDALRHAIADAVVGGAEDLRGPSATAGSTVVARHARALRAALIEVDGALGLIGARDGGRGSPELLAGHLRSALDQFAELTGRISPDEVIGRVFATFCVGK